MKSHRHFILNKPYGFLSQFVNNQSTRKNKKLLGELFDFPEVTMAVGRLDQDSEGLLLLTTDGKFSLEARSTSVEKEYHVQVDGLISTIAIEQLRKGIQLSHKGKSYLTLPAKAEIIKTNYPQRRQKIRDERHGPTSWVSITIAEGKFRQVRKMTAAVGFPTLRLIRIRIGGITLGDLQPGEVRAIENPDILL